MHRAKCWAGSWPTMDPSPSPRKSPVWSGTAGPVRTRPGQDRPVLSHILETCLQTELCPLVLVLGHHEDDIRKALAASGSNLAGITIATHPDFRTSIASSRPVFQRAGPAFRRSGGKTSLLFTLAREAAGHNRPPRPNSWPERLAAVAGQAVESLVSRWSWSPAWPVTPIRSGSLKFNGLHLYSRDEKWNDTLS